MRNEVKKTRVDILEDDVASWYVNPLTEMLINNITKAIEKEKEDLIDNESADVPSIIELIKYKARISCLEELLYDIKEGNFIEYSPCSDEF